MQTFTSIEGSHRERVIKGRAGWWYLGAGGVARLIELFSAKKYSGFFFHRDRLLPIAEFDISRLQSLESVKQLADAEASNPRPREYINNFIFLPDESTALMPRLQSIAFDLGHARRN